MDPVSVSFHSEKPGYVVVTRNLTHPECAKPSTLQLLQETRDSVEKAGYGSIWSQSRTRGSHACFYYFPKGSGVEGLAQFIGLPGLNHGIFHLHEIGSSVVLLIAKQEQDHYQEFMRPELKKVFGIPSLHSCTPRQYRTVRYACARMHGCAVVRVVIESGLRCPLCKGVIRSRHDEISVRACDLVKTYRIGDCSATANDVMQIRALRCYSRILHELKALL